MPTTLDISKLLSSSTGVGIVAVLAALMLFALISDSRRAFWFLLSMTICGSSLIFSVDQYRPTLATPIEELTSLGNVVVAFLLLCAMVAMARNRGQRSRRLVSAAAIWYLAFELVFSVFYLFDGNMQRGIVAPCLFLLTFAVFGVSLPRFIQTPFDIEPLFKMVATAIVLMLALTAYQLARDSEAIMRNSRFCGLSGNPQLFASYCAVLLFPMVCFSLRSPQYFWKVLCLLLSAVLTLFIILCGSRTGMLMAVVGIGIMFRKTGRAYLLLPLLCVVLLIGWRVLRTEESYTMLEGRFGEYPTNNTRLEVWGMMWEVFKENPLLGSIEDVTDSESSYLGALSRFGIVGTTPLMISMMLTFTIIVRLYRIRSTLGNDEILVDLVAAGFISIAVGALSEGFLMATRTPILYMIYVYFAVISYLLNRNTGEGAAVARRLPGE